MNRLLLLAGLAVAVVLVAGANGADEKPMSIKEVMKVAHSKDGYRAKVTAAVKDKNFDTISTVVKDWEKAAVDLSKNTPPKGEADSWKKLTEAYTKNIQAMAKAAGDKDVKGVQASLKTVGSSCGACHKSHR
ncbi:MAG: cytochrome c [Gemmataceae bacterium]